MLADVDRDAIVMQADADKNSVVTWWGEWGGGFVRWRKEGFLSGAGSLFERLFRLLSCDLLRSHLRAGDVAGRIGGGKFAVLLGGADLDGACTVARRIQDQVRYP
ncbi:diguanylate cyclase domain-containing protein [Paraburkholderia tagetis]|uniref:GGDEF domain-containing protein n=1 Tax=Paraburkholderia tagetis TaxID=2913261 RepID=A0A9X1RMZ1_9BURK|nr:diguanylate cyclase [Paraburkholderia tagetis]MCG5072033.1 hypothetical protein [Paraburkholderia tagetis]